MKREGLKIYELDYRDMLRLIALSGILEHQDSTEKFFSENRIIRTEMVFDWSFNQSNQAWNSAEKREFGHQERTITKAFFFEIPDHENNSDGTNRIDIFSFGYCFTSNKNFSVQRLFKNINPWFWSEMSFKVQKYQQNYELFAFFGLSKFRKKQHNKNQFGGMDF